MQKPPAGPWLKARGKNKMDTFYYNLTSDLMFKNGGSYCFKIHVTLRESLGLFTNSDRFDITSYFAVQKTREIEQAKSMSREEYFKFCHGDWDEALRREEAARDPEERRAVAAGEG